MSRSRFLTRVWAVGLLAVLAATPGLPLPARAGVPQLAIENALSLALQKEQIKKWCEDSRAAVHELGWKIDPCVGPTGAIPWRIGGTSVEGRPLIFAEFGDATASNTTLVFSAVHGDEITPLYIGIQVAHWLVEHPDEHGKSHVIVAPLVNPDGFFRKPRTRTNAHGVDVNRNFDTRDWSAHALKAWKVKQHSDPRRFPGSMPKSEPETVFQEELIRLVHPQKILAVHSPLNHLDYDGPSAISLSHFPSDYVHECLKLRARLKAVSTGFFPGSLGNYAGQELGIPTLTLELPTADPRKADAYWSQFSKGIKTMIEFELANYARR